MSKAASKALKQAVMSELMELQSLPAVSMEELAKHNTAEDAWVMVDGVVYNVTKFAKLHPGGRAVLLRSAGTDATVDFKQVHADSVLKRYANLRVGRLAVEELDPAEAKKLFTKKAEEKWLPLSGPYFNDIRGTLKSPYVQQRHINFQMRLRAFLDKEIVPNVDKWCEANKYPRELHNKFYDAGLYAMAYPAQYGGTPLQADEGQFDAFTFLLQCYEFGRSALGGVVVGVLAGFAIGAPPIINYGSEELKNTIGRDVVTAKKLICLGITEPWGGSDVATIRTTAVKDGDFYVVSGEKKFITGALNADYMTTAVRTDPSKKGMNGISLLVIPLNLPGVEREAIKTQGWWGSNTAYIMMDKVCVLAKNLIGKENEGFRYIMENFNTERFNMMTQGAGACHRLIEESIKYARNRKTFGQPLIKSQVIRHKIAAMAMKTEALFAFCEQLAYHLNQKVPAIDLAPRIALGKVFATQTFEFCAREASQIFGGNSYMRTGPGEKIERFYREVRATAISGGSEEIMFELAMRGSKL
jgi:alkylation response protein AidB-like acyl-CoA dehydrogenase/cytochrome b involved in lipid metabolism